MSAFRRECIEPRSSWPFQGGDKSRYSFTRSVLCHNQDPSGAGERAIIAACSPVRGPENAFWSYFCYFYDNNDIDLESKNASKECSNRCNDEYLFALWKCASGDSATWRSVRRVATACESKRQLGEQGEGNCRYIVRCASSPLAGRYAKSYALPVCTNANSESRARVIVGDIVKPAAVSTVSARISMPRRGAGNCSPGHSGVPPAQDFRTGAGLSVYCSSDGQRDGDP
jgi:hypothetical protein